VDHPRRAPPPRANARRIYEVRHFIAAQSPHGAVIQAA
jgi:hypothetical protein